MGLVVGSSLCLGARSVGSLVLPRLVPALLQLPDTQRAAVWLVHACQWRYSEVAEALGTTTSMVGNHVSRALSRLRRELEVNARA
ncbi:MAG: RNA polymerase sigma factor [Acidimicrobiales bacterium]